MTALAPASLATAPDRRTWWREVLAGTALVVADLVAFVWWLSHRVDVYSAQHDDVGRNVNFFLGSDLVQPVLLGVWVLVAVNGALLCLRSGTRRTGIALLLAVTAGGLVAAGAWVALLVAFATG